MTKNMKSTTWFSSDFHYGHKNLVAGVTVWTDKRECRNFQTLEEHNATLVTNINKVVKENDVLYFLGDWSFGGVDNILAFRDKIKCRSIHLILGNHDKALYQKQKFLVESGKFLSISHIKNIKIEDQNIVLCHFPFRSWEKSGKGSWMLHGHCHGSLAKYEQKPKGFWATLFPFFFRKQYYKTMDVGIDTHPEFRPYSFEAIKVIMENKQILNDVDYHE